MHKMGPCYLQMESKPEKWPCTWVNGAITPINGVIANLLKGPTLYTCAYKIYYALCSIWIFWIHFPCKWDLLPCFTRFGEGQVICCQSGGAQETPRTLYSAANMKSASNFKLVHIDTLNANVSYLNMDSEPSITWKRERELRAQSKIKASQAVSSSNIYIYKL